MSRSGLFILMLSSLMLCSFGFTMDRSALVPSVWDTAPSLDTYQRVIVNPTLKDKMQVTGMNKILQAANAKMSENMAENQTLGERSTTKKIETEINHIEIKSINETIMRNDASNSSEENVDNIITPRNVILLLIDERDQEQEKREENSWKDYKERLPFAIEGFLQSCRGNFERANFSIDNASVFERKEKSNCEFVLRSNIGELLSWARQVRGMTTGAVSGNNFSIPLFPKYESSRFNESNANLEPRKSKRDSSDKWQMIDLSNQAKSVSSLTATDPKTKSESQAGEMNHDVIWDIFDVFSKIRMAFFHSLIESLHRNDGTLKDEFSSHKPFFFKSTATNLIENTIRELKSIPNEKGYMLITVAPKNEGAAVIDLLQHEASPKDTLLIITQICVGDQRSVPFVAQGPNCQSLREAKVIDDLPIIIKKAMITRDCHDAGCKNRQRRDVPIISHVPSGEILSRELPAQKQVVRNENAEKPKMSTLNNTDVKSSINTEKTTIGKEIQAISSTSLKTIPCDLAAVFGVMLSILAKTAMSS